MIKDKTILDLIQKLKSNLDFNLLEIVDYWPSDLCAIGLQKGNKLVYISTFNSLHKDEVKYDYDLELYDKKDDVVIIKEGREITEKELIKEIKKFLEI